MGQPKDQPNDDPRITLGMNLTKSCKYVFNEQGFSKEDLIFMLHGIMGQVLSWERETKPPKGKPLMDDFPELDLGDDP